jgi:hypothetical protein
MSLLIGGLAAALVIGIGLVAFRSAGRSQEGRPSSGE